MIERNVPKANGYKLYRFVPYNYLQGSISLGPLHNYGPTKAMGDTIINSSSRVIPMGNPIFRKFRHMVYILGELKTFFLSIQGNAVGYYKCDCHYINIYIVCIRCENFLMHHAYYDVECKQFCRCLTNNVWCKTNNRVFKAAMSMCHVKVRSLL